MEILIEDQDENYPNVLTSRLEYYQYNNTEFFPWQANPRVHFTGNKHACFTGRTFLTADPFGVSQIAQCVSVQRRFTLRGKLKCSVLFLHARNSSKMECGHFTHSIDDVLNVAL